jgi:hypothetical protein
MNKNDASLLSRRQFARRAAVLSASAAIVPGEALLPDSLTGSQDAANTAQLSPEGRLEADSRYRQILGLYGDRLDDAQKAHIKKMCEDLQPTLEKIRKYKLENGNEPALYLKPLVEREKKRQSAAAAKKP